jgi:hypothetical protein
MVSQFPSTTNKAGHLRPKAEEMPGWGFRKADPIAGLEHAVPSVLLGKATLP